MFVCVSKRAGVAPIFSFVFTLPVYVRMHVTQCVLAVAVILKRSTFFAGISECSAVSVISPLTPLLCLYSLWDPLSSLDSTPVSIQIPNQLDCNMCRMSNCFSFFSCKDDSDRLMKRASSSCRIFVCVVLAAYLKYWSISPVSLVMLAIHLAPFFIVTHTHTHTHTHTQIVKEARRPDFHIRGLLNFLVVYEHTPAHKSQKKKNWLFHMKSWIFWGMLWKNNLKVWMAQRWIWTCNVSA